MRPPLFFPTKPTKSSPSFAPQPLNFFRFWVKMAPYKSMIAILIRIMFRSFHPDQPLWWQRQILENQSDPQYTTHTII